MDEYDEDKNPSVSDAPLPTGTPERTGGGYPTLYDVATTSLLLSGLSYGLLTPSGVCSVA